MGTVTAARGTEEYDHFLRRELSPGRINPTSEASPEPENSIRLPGWAVKGGEAPALDRSSEARTLQCRLPPQESMNGKVPFWRELSPW